MLRLALLDMNAGVPNQGMRCIRRIAEDFRRDFTADVFDVRAGGELPGDDYDAYIFSGGPGTPLATGEAWEAPFFRLVDQLWEHNRVTEDPSRRKYCFFICHSFQLAVRHFGLGDITARRSKSFGTFPVHRSLAGEDDVLFRGLDEVFYVADFREYQVTRAIPHAIEAIGAEILAYEKVRPQVPYERAIMAIRFSPEWVGTQFHPEADAAGMTLHFNDPERRAVVIDEHGLEKYEEMMSDLADPERIGRTNEVVIPNFLRRARRKLLGRAPADGPEVARAAARRAA